MSMMKRSILQSAACLALALAAGCSSVKLMLNPKVDAEPFGRTAGGQPVQLYTLRNANGMKVGVITYGAAVVSIKVPDRKGVIGEVVLGHEGLPQYERGTALLGGLIGRHAGRIAFGHVELDGKEYALTTNSPPHHIDGGERGFQNAVWEASATSIAEGTGVRMVHTSPAGEEGYPGNLSVEVVYSLTPDNELRVSLRAETDAPTLVNPALLLFFNLAGPGKADILSHVVSIAADTYLPLTDTLVPTGELAPVDRTPFDLRESARIGARVDDPTRQLALTGGFDHTWVLRNQEERLALAAQVYELSSGRILQVLTTEPTLHFDTGNRLDGRCIGREGVPCRRRSAFSLMAEHAPDAQHQSHFPTVVLRPGEVFRSTTVYRFSVIGTEDAPVR